MKCKLLLTLILMVVYLGIPLVEAQIEPTFVFRQDVEKDLKFSCFDEVTGIPCDANYLCNITIQYPNATLMFDNFEATRNPSFYNITLKDTSVLGFHQYQSYCTNTSAGGFSPELYYLINSTGEVFNIEKALVYLFVLFLALTIFGLCLWGAIKIPFDNKRDDVGKVVGMNDLKYVKIFLWFMSYLIAISILFMGQTVAGILEMGVAFGLFRWGFWFLIVFLLPSFIMLMTVMFIRFWADKKVFDMIERNVFIK